MQRLYFLKYATKIANNFFKSFFLTDYKSALSYLHDRQKFYSPLVADTGGGEDVSGTPTPE